MINMEDLNPKDKFFSLFPFGELNQSATIAKDDDVLIKDSNGNIVLRGNAEVCLDVVPDYGINVHFTSTNLSNFDYSKILDQFKSRKPFEVELKEHKTQFKGILTENNGWNSLVFSPAVQPIIGVGHGKTEMQYVVFHLFNFRDTFSKITSSEQMEIPSYPIKPVQIQHIHLKNDKWVVNLRSLVSDAQRQKYVGCEMTHVCYLEKADQTSFQGKEASEILGALRYFFSFAKGAWCNPVCAVGFDSSRNRVWEYWFSPKVSHSSDISWFDEHHPEQLGELFPGFMSRWDEKEWNDTLMKVLYWYLIANHTNIDAGIILTQAALERLSFEYFKVNPIDGHAAKKLKDLFYILEIPIGITDSTPELKELVKEVNKLVKTKKKLNKLVEMENTQGLSKWTDAPNVFTGMRNYLVHPEHRYHPLKFEPAIDDVNRLGLWYLELSLLKLFNYSGEYYNRLKIGWIGEVEHVPWKK
jgi:hypothetical protein